MVRWISIVLCVVGLTVGIYTVATEGKAQPQQPLARPASVNPFPVGVAALGLIEAGGRNVGIVAPEPGLVTVVHAKVGDRVEAGQVLMELDGRTLEAQLIRARAQVEAASAEIARWNALPRAEDIPPLEATLAQARAALADRQEQLRLTQEAVSRGAATSRDVSIATFAVQGAQAEVARAEADLARMRAGGWQPDLVIAQANLARANAEVEALTILMDRLKVRAPRGGVVLRREIEPGELAGTDGTRPAMILGDLSTLQVRAQVDEEDIALVREGATAVARTRGSVVREVSLRLVRIEPFARPKMTLSGANAERTDTRVIDVVLEVVNKPEGVPLFPGQAVDVFIEVAPAE